MGSPSVSDALGGGAPLCVRFGNLFNSPVFFSVIHGGGRVSGGNKLVRKKFV